VDWPQDDRYRTAGYAQRALTVVRRLITTPYASRGVRQCGTRFEEVGGRLEVQKEVRSAFCQGDAARLLLVLHNVLANALKYSPAGGVVRVAVSRHNAGSGDRSVLHCAVTDAGPGVPAEFRARLGEIFPGGTPPTGGCQGLYLCKHIITTHSGNIGCDAGDHGVGTCLALTLPGEGCSRILTG